MHAERGKQEGRSDTADPCSAQGQKGHARTRGPLSPSETKRPAGDGGGRRGRGQKRRWGRGRSQGRGDEGPQRASSEFCIRRCTPCLILLYHSPFGDAMLRILLPHARGHRVWDSRVGAIPVHGRNKVRRWSARRRGLPLGASPLRADSSRSSSPAPRENVTGGVCRHWVLAIRWVPEMTHSCRGAVGEVSLGYRIWRPHPSSRPASAIAMVRRAVACC